MRKPLHIWLDSDQEGEARKKALDRFFQENAHRLQQSNLQLVRDKPLADYALYIGKDSCLFFPVAENGKDNQARLPGYSRPIEDRGFMDNILADAAHIAHWHFVRNLKSPASGSGLAQAIHWQFYFQTGVGEDGEEEIWPEWMDQEKSIDLDAGMTDGMRTVCIPLVRPRDENHIPFTRLRLRIENRSTEKRLFVGLIYLSQLFGVEERVLEKAVMDLMPNQGNVLWAFGKRGIDFTLEPFIYDFDWPEETFFFKLIASPQPFTLDFLRQDPLPPPSRFHAHSGNARMAKSGESISPDLPEWDSKIVEIRVRNPYHKAAGTGHR